MPKVVVTIKAYIVSDVNDTRDDRHGKFVLTEKAFLIEDLGFCPKTNMLIFKQFF